MDRVGRNKTRKESYVLCVSVHITLTLFEFQELDTSPELSLWRLKRLSEPGFEDLYRPKNVWVVQLET